MKRRHPQPLSGYAVRLVTPAGDRWDRVSDGSLEGVVRVIPCHIVARGYFLPTNLPPGWFAKVVRVRTVNGELEEVV